MNISNDSFKRLSKLKKSNNRPHDQDYHFLLRSMEREREDVEGSRQLVKSILINPTKTAPNSDFITQPAKNILNMTQRVKGQCFDRVAIQPKHNQAKYFFENVKNLGDSNVSRKPLRTGSSKSQNKKVNKSRQSKGKQNNKNYLNKNSSKVCDSKQNSWNSNKTSKLCHYIGRSQTAVISELIYKCKKYITSTNRIVQAISCEAEPLASLVDKMNTNQQQLIKIINCYETIQQCEKLVDDELASTMNRSIKTTGFNLNIPLNQQHLNPTLLQSVRPNSSEQIYKIITDLQSEKQKLNSLISQHELTNIKMFIKINEGQSQQIQQCKKQLSSLYDKYKKLQNMILKENKKFIESYKENIKLNQTIDKMKKNHDEVVVVMEKYQRYMVKIKEKYEKVVRELEDNKKELDKQRQNQQLRSKERQREKQKIREKQRQCERIVQRERQRQKNSLKEKCFSKQPNDKKNIKIEIHNAPTYSHARKYSNNQFTHPNQHPSNSANNNSTFQFMDYNNSYNTSRMSHPNSIHSSNYLNLEELNQSHQGSNLSEKKSFVEGVQWKSGTGYVGTNTTFDEKHLKEKGKQKGKQQFLLQKQMSFCLQGKMEEYRIIAAQAKTIENILKNKPIR